MGDNRIMDEKRELLMNLLFGAGQDSSAMTASAAQLQRLAQAQQKADTINQTLDDSEKSANILRQMMQDDQP